MTISRLTLLDLALQAIDDEAAREVLSDAMQESGWWDERLTNPGFISRAHQSALPCVYRFFPDSDRGLTRGRMTKTRALAIAAVLLFG